MRTYSEEEKKAAQAALPQVLQDFLKSKELSGAYETIQKDLRLNIRQTGVVIDVVTLVLLGLEKQDVLPVTIQNALPELSQEEINKLLLTIDEKIFKEARLKLVQKD